jgi:hypothetical protein
MLRLSLVTKVITKPEKKDSDVPHCILPVALSVTAAIMNSIVGNRARGMILSSSNISALAYMATRFLSSALARL